MIWADNCRIFSHDRVVLTVMIKDLIGELIGVGHGTETRILVVDEHI